MADLPSNLFPMLEGVVSASESHEAVPDALQSSLLLVAQRCLAGSVLRLVSSRIARNRWSHAHLGGYEMSLH